MNTNQPSPTDDTSDLNPRLAYVLGEATEAERTAIENSLRSVPAAQRELADFQQLVTAASLEVRTTPSANRSADLRRAIERQLEKTVTPTPAAPKTDARRRRDQRLWLAFTGGTICVAGIGMFLFSDFMRHSRKVATVNVTQAYPFAEDHEGLQVELACPEDAPPLRRKLSSEVIVDIDAIPVPDLDVSSPQLELSDLASETAPRNDLAKSIGAFQGSGLQGQGAAPRKEMHPAGGGRNERDFEGRTASSRSSIVTAYGGSSAKHPALGKLPADPADDLFGDVEQPTVTRNSEQYRPITDNPFRTVAGEQALSTFSVDVDSAAYANVRRFLLAGQRPPVDAVRIEELLNYFSYQYPQPTGPHPFAVNMETATCPWDETHRLVRIGIKGKEIAKEKRPPSNLVFLIDVSGSMSSDDKLPLLKQGLNLLVRELTEDDRVSIITYAGDAGEKLPSTNGTDKQKIQAAIDALSAGGSTHGSAGIQMAYAKAREHFISGGTNRVLWATDGDLNVGVTRDEELIELVKDKAKSGVFVSVLGFGTGNLKDGKLEQIADNGNGIYAYIDSLREARRVLVEQMSGSLVTIAKDVKLQVEFNPAEVASYRLIGYENRVLATQDFHNDKKDAGDIGAGHTVTALYEIVPATNATPQPEKPLELKYQKSAVSAPETQTRTGKDNSGELLTLKLRYKKPDADVSQLIEVPLKNNPQRFTASTPDFQFASAVAAFGMILRNSPHRGTSNFDQVLEIATAALSEDTGGYRAEFVDLVRKAKELSR